MVGEQKSLGVFWKGREDSGFETSKIGGKKHTRAERGGFRDNPPPPPLLDMPLKGEELKEDHKEGATSGRGAWGRGGGGGTNYRGEAALVGMQLHGGGGGGGDEKRGKKKYERSRS